jgi:type VI secretion system protein ImpD
MESVPDARLDRLQARFADVEAVTSFLRRAVLDLEDLLSTQLTAVLEAPAFQQMEARWAGLASVVWAKRGAASVKIKILDLSWEELSRDLHYTSEMRRSVLYNLMGQRELDTLGGEPFGLAMLDHGLSMSLETEFDDLYTAQLVCELAEAVMCPIIMGLAEDFFGETDAAWLTDARRITNILNGEDYHSWQTLRSLPNARFLALVMLRTQLRGRYEDLDIGFRFHQWPSESDGLWGSAGYDFLRTAIAEFLRCAWFGFLKLVGATPGEGAVLASTDHPIPKGCVRGGRAQLRMTRNLAHLYSELGFIPLAESPKTNLLYFVGNRSVTETGGSAAAEIVTQLQSVMIACRIVHYLKVQIRALIGQVKTSAECEQILNDWFDPYVSGSSSSNELQARFPLQGARVRVTESASDRARFQCEVIVRPQYQIDNVLGDITLRTDFGAGKPGKAA